MATATPAHGSVAKFTYNAVDYSDHLQGEVGIDKSWDTVDTTVFGATAGTSVVSPVCVTEPFDVELLCDSAAFNALIALQGTANACIYQPMGTTGGLPKITGSGIMTKFSVMSSDGDVSRVKMTITPTAAWTWTTN